MVVFSALIAVLWYWGILPALVKALGWALRRSMGISGPLGISGAASLFLGMIETPMVVRAYLAKITRSEFFTVMTFGMSTVAGSVMVLYASLLGDRIEGTISHILTASLLNVVGAVYISKLMIPEQEQAVDSAMENNLRYQSLMDAVTRGTADGLQVAMNVGAMLLVMIAFVAMIDGMLGVFTVGGEALELGALLGWIFAPLAWLLGVPWAEAQIAGELLGVKVALNELVAYIQLAEVSGSLSERTNLLMVYGLCGFANLSSMGILLGGLTVLVPERKSDYLKLAPRSIISGTLATMTTTAIVATVL